MISLNVNALFHMTRAVLPRMIARGTGHVCTIGPLSGRSALGGGSCYAGTNAFVPGGAGSRPPAGRDPGGGVWVVGLDVRGGSARIPTMKAGGIWLDVTCHKRCTCEGGGRAETMLSLYRPEKIDTPAKLLRSRSIMTGSGGHGP